MSGGVWVMSEADLLRMLTRAHEGEPPGSVLAEEYANATHEYPEEDGLDGDG